jgi:hypothetical protein
MANPWFLSLGLTTIFAALFAKTWRIHRLYRNAKVFRRVTIRARDVLWPLVTLLSINVVILTVWTSLDPLTWNQFTVLSDSFGRAVNVRYSCFEFDNGGADVSLTCLVLMVAVNLSASFLLNIESYRARNLPSEFNESKYIAISNLILLEASIVSVPILIVVREQRPVFVLVRSILNFILCIGVLLPVFLPKFTNQESNKSKRNIPYAGPSRNAVGTNTAMNGNRRCDCEFICCDLDNLTSSSIAEVRLNLATRRSERLLINCFRVLFRRSPNGPCDNGFPNEHSRSTTSQETRDSNRVYILRV